MIAVITEGQDDAAILVALLQHIHQSTTVQANKEDTRKRVIIENGQAFDVIECGGRDKLSQKLNSLRNFLEYSAIVILFDSDGDTQKTFSYLQKHIEDAEFSVPQKLNEFTGSSPDIIVKLIEPYDLESLVYPAIAQADLMPIRDCVDTFIECLASNEVSPEPKNLSKTKIKAFFAAKASERGRIELTITGAVREKLFDLKHPNFKPLIDFLHQLLKDKA